jgi:hypothetical protein
VVEPDVTDTTFAVCLDVLLYAQHVEHRDERLDLHVQREGEFLNADPSAPRGEFEDNPVAECGLVDASTSPGLRLTHLDGRRSAAGDFLGRTLPVTPPRGCANLPSFRFLPNGTEK